VYQAVATSAGARAVQDLGFTLVSATPELLSGIEGSVRQPHQVDPLRALLRRGVPGWFALKDGAFAGHAFLAFARHERERFGGVWLYPGEMAITQLFVAPAFRGGGLGGALHVQLVANAVRDYASTTNIAWTADYNIASQRMLARHGCTRIGTIDRWLFWHRPLLSTYRGQPPRR